MLSFKVDSIYGRHFSASSLWGPGAEYYMYLTLFACHNSFAWHPRKRKLDKINGELIAFVAIPIIVALDILLRLRSYSDSISVSTMVQRAELAADLEAALKSLHGFHFVGMGLVGGLPHACTKIRSVVMIPVLLFWVAFYCVEASTLKHDLLPDLSEQTFDELLYKRRRSFVYLVLAFITLRWSLNIILGILDVFESGLIWLTGRSDYSPSHPLLAQSHLGSIMDVVTVLIVFVNQATGGPAIGAVSRALRKIHVETIVDAPTWLEIYVWRPRSGASLTDYDQIAITLAGSLVLGSSIQSALKAWRKERAARAQKRSQTDEFKIHD